MTKAVRVHEIGGPEVLTYEDAQVPAPAAGEVLSASMPLVSILSIHTSAAASARRRSCRSSPVTKPPAK